MKNKDKIRLIIYENKIKNMSKEELIEELKSVSDLNEILLYLSGMLTGADIFMLYSIPYCETTGSQIAATVGSVVTLIMAGASICAYLDDKTKMENKLEILYKYVDKDDNKKEKDNTKTLNS